MTTRGFPVRKKRILGEGEGGRRPRLYQFECSCENLPGPDALEAQTSANGIVDEGLHPLAEGVGVRAPVLEKDIGLGYEHVKTLPTRTSVGII